MSRDDSFATCSHRVHHIPLSSTSHPDNPIPEEPQGLPEYHISIRTPSIRSPRPSGESLSSSFSSIDSETLSTPPTEPQVDEEVAVPEKENAAAINLPSRPRLRRASTSLISKNADDVRALLGDVETGTHLVEKLCCGGGCCLLKAVPPLRTSTKSVPVTLPENEAFRSLDLNLGALALDTPLTDVAPLPPLTVSFDPVPATEPRHETIVTEHPPRFVQPHPPYEVFSAPVFHARELTKPGAVKRTFHFDLDITDYPEEGGVDFKVGGAIGICPPNHPDAVEEIFNLLGVPKNIRDKPVLLKTSAGRWPTIWGDEKARELVTTRRELLTWCSDIQSYPPTKQLLRLLAESADAGNERKVLLYLCSAEGQGAFCDLRTRSHITLSQLLHAFPSSKPPLAHLLSVLNQLMPRFYSLSNDPHVSSSREGLAGRRLVEMAVTIHETPNWRNGLRTGVGSGFLERIAQAFIALTNTSTSSSSSPSPAPPSTTPKLHIPMFRGLMANPLSQRFGGDGPMMLIGAGVGMAPFRGFILNRLRNANCANKIWLVQGVRDSMVDELYSGELGAHEREIKKVVQSRRTSVANIQEDVGTLSLDITNLNKLNGIIGKERGQDIDRAVPDPSDKSTPPKRLTKSQERKEARYVQDEVRLQADIVWYVINALDGRIFVCGSSMGMGEGVERALTDVAMDKGNLNEEEAKEFWEEKKKDGQYITETW